MLHVFASFFISAEFLTAMEIWVIGTIVFVFLALVEYGIVLKVISSGEQKAKKVEDEVEEKKKMHRMKKKALQIWKGRSTDVSPTNSRFVASAPTSEKASFSVTANNMEEDAPEEIQEEAAEATHKIDKIALLVLPILFLIFNMAYWPYYNN